MKNMERAKCINEIKSHEWYQICYDFWDFMGKCLTRLLRHWVVDLNITMELGSSPSCCSECNSWCLLGWFPGTHVWGLYGGHSSWVCWRHFREKNQWMEILPHEERILEASLETSYSNLLIHCKDPIASTIPACNPRSLLKYSNWFLYSKPSHPWVTNSEFFLELSCLCSPSTHWRHRFLICFRFCVHSSLKIHKGRVVQICTFQS